MTSTTPDPPEFETAVRAYLDPSRGQFNHEQMLLTFLSVERFRQWADIVRGFRPLAGTRFLSSGCGFAGSLIAYRDAGAAVAVGVDVDPEYLKFGSLRTAGLDGAGVVAYDGLVAPFPDGTFDVIESMDVIEHTPDPLEYLRELRRVLAPDGLILLVAPNRVWPVEQHLAILGPPWLPVEAADALFSTLASIPLLPADRRFRYAKLRGMRTQNMSLRGLHRLAGRAGMSLEVLRPREHDAWPLPRQHLVVERLAEHPVFGRLAPVRTIAAILRRA